MPCSVFESTGCEVETGIFDIDDEMGRECCTAGAIVFVPAGGDGDAAESEIC